MCNTTNFVHLGVQARNIVVIMAVAVRSIPSGTFGRLMALHVYILLLLELGFQSREGHYENYSSG